MRTQHKGFKVDVSMQSLDYDHVAMKYSSLFRTFSAGECRMTSRRLINCSECWNHLLDKKDPYMFCWTVSLYVFFRPPLQVTGDSGQGLRKKKWSQLGFYW